MQAAYDKCVGGPRAGEVYSGCGPWTTFPHGMRSVALILLCF